MSCLNVKKANINRGENNGSNRVNEHNQYIRILCTKQFTFCLMEILSSSKHCIFGWQPCDLYAFKTGRSAYLSATLQMK